MRALIAEDESVLANNIRTCLEHEEFERKRFEVDIAENGAVAMRLIQDNYDVVILDLKMPEVDGTQIIEALSMIHPQKRPWVILITAYPGAYETAYIGIKMGVQALLQKPFELTDLMRVVRELVQSRQQLLESAKHGTKLVCNWALAFSETGTAFIQVNGLLNFVESCPLPWTKSDSLAVSQQAELTGALINTSGSPRTFRRFHARAVGTQLFEKLYVGEIEKSFVSAGSIVLHNHDLKLAFIGPRHFLNLPLEFLNDGADYLVLRHPMRRVITGIRTRRSAGLSDLLSELQEKREKLRILLVASNTPPLLSSVDQEVAAIHSHLKDLLSPRNFVIDYLPTEEATCEEVLARLKGCQYHILHYAGHGYHDEGFPEKSSLFFWEKKGAQGNAKAITVNTLKNTLRLRGHDLRFIYLSCCYGTATSGEAALLNDNFLGIADGLLMAGVPSVMGYRWPISDVGAKELALSFYDSLFVQGELDTALFNARCKVAGAEEGQGLEDWLSPILIVQG